jgi:hypothetical protein
VTGGSRNDKKEKFFEETYLVNKYREKQEPVKFLNRKRVTA